MHRSGFCPETRDGLDGEGTIRMGSECHIHKRSNSLMVRDVMHLGNFGSCRGWLACGKSDVHVHGDRNGLEVLKTILAMLKSKILTSGERCENTTNTHTLITLQQIVLGGGTKSSYFKVDRLVCLRESMWGRTCRILGVIQYIKYKELDFRKVHWDSLWMRLRRSYHTQQSLRERERIWPGWGPVLIYGTW